MLTFVARKDFSGILLLIAANRFLPFASADALRASTSIRSSAGARRDVFDGRKEAFVVLMSYGRPLAK